MAVEHLRAFDGGLFIAGMVFHEKGDCVPTHAHTFDHMMFTPTGGIKVEQGTGEYLRPRKCEVIEKPFSFFWIAKNVPHRITGIKRGAVGLCLHATRWEDGRPVLYEETKDLTTYEILKLTERL